MQQLKTLKLVRSTNLGIAHSTDTAVSWSSAEVNTGPASWWSSGSATQIVMPWAGLYFVSFHCSWEANVNVNRRSVHLNKTTTIGSGNFVAGTSNPNTGSGENSANQNFGWTIDVASAGDVYVMTVWQNSGTALNLTSRVGSLPPAQISFLYLEG